MRDEDDSGCLSLGEVLTLVLRYRGALFITFSPSSRPLLTSPSDSDGDGERWAMLIVYCHRSSA